MTRAHFKVHQDRHADAVAGDSSCDATTSAHLEDIINEDDEDDEDDGMTPEQRALVIREIEESIAEYRAGAPTFDAFETIAELRAARREPRCKRRD